MKLRIISQIALTAMTIVSCNNSAEFAGSNSSLAAKKTDSGTGVESADGTGLDPNKPTSVSEAKIATPDIKAIVESDNPAVGHDSDSQTDTANPADKKMLTLTKRAELKVDQQEKIVNSNDRIEFIFLIDNSRSMTSVILKMKDSLREFVSKLQSEKANFNGRFMSFGMLLDQLNKTNVSGNEYYIPINLDRGIDRLWVDPIYNRGNLDGIYKSAYLFNETTPIAEVEAKLDLLASQVNSKEYFNEPGICLSMDYLNWLDSKKAENLPGSNMSENGTHFIVLSDEDNSLKFDEYSNYKLQRSLEQYCAVNKETLKQANCSYTYNVNYKNYQGCPAGATDSLVDLSTANYCVTDRYLCPGTRKRYSCTAKGATQIRDIDLGAMNVERCTATTKYICSVKVDGVMTQKTVTNRGEANNLISAGSTCTPDFGGPFESLDIYPGTDKSKILGLVANSCERYSCKDEGFEMQQYNEGSQPAGCTKKDGLFLAGKYSFRGDYVTPAIEEFNCATKYGQYYRDFTNTSGYPLASNICKSATASFPSGVTKSPSTVNVNRVRTISFNKAQTEDQVKAYFGTLVDLKRNTITSVTGPIGRDMQAGEFTPDQCSSVADLRRSFLTGTPDNFVLNFKNIHGNKKVFWHSVVSTKGEKCDPKQDWTPTLGATYSNLSTMTSGIIQDICEANFDKFVEKLTKKAVQYVVTKYAVPESLRLDWKARKGVKVMRGDVELQAGVDFDVGEDFIAFRDSAGLTNGEVLTIVAELDGNAP